MRSESRRSFGGTAPIILLLVAALFVPRPSFAGDSCLISLGAMDEGGVGGSGYGDDEGGIGGSGLQGGDSESGIGGSGLRGGDDEGGIGGSAWLNDAPGGDGIGIIGTITAFGSICVNGVHIDYGPDTPVEVNGRAGDPEDFAIGQVVEASVEKAADGRFTARRIAVRNAVVGPVTQIDDSRRRVRIAGQVVLVPERVDTRTEKLLQAVVPGEALAVSGLRRSDGVIVASRLSRSDSGDLALVAGPLTRVRADSVYLSDLRVKTDRESVDLALSQGDLVRVRGRWSSGSGQLEDAHIALVSGPARDARYLSIEGYVQGREGAVLGLPGLRVDASAVAEKVGSLVPDTRVLVSGRVDDEGVLRAGRIGIHARQLGPWWREQGAAGDARGEHRGRARDGDSSDRAERAEHGDRAERPEHAEHLEHPERYERYERAERMERPERMDRPERVERPERPESGERPGHPGH